MYLLHSLLGLNNTALCGIPHLVYPFIKKLFLLFGYYNAAMNFHLQAFSENIYFHLFHIYMYMLPMLIHMKYCLFPTVAAPFYTPTIIV